MFFMQINKKRNPSTDVIFQVELIALELRFLNGTILRKGALKHKFCQPLQQPSDNMNLLVMYRPSSFTEALCNKSCYI